LFLGKGIMKYYVDEYQVGYQIVKRDRPSLERYPISHGSFVTKEDAEDWAKKNLGGKDV